MRLSFASFTLQPPLLQTSPSPWPSTFPLPLRPSEKERGPIRPYKRDFGFCACEKNPLSPTCGRPAPPVRPALCFGRQGERCISNEISRYKRKIRVYRFDLSRGGPCVRTESSYISAGLSLLSKGLRGGKSRRLREESLLRWMIASEDAKNPLKARE